MELDLGSEDQKGCLDILSVEPVILCFVIGHYCDLVAVLFFSFIVHTVNRICKYESLYIQKLQFVSFSMCFS